MPEQYDTMEKRLVARLCELRIERNRALDLLEQLRYGHEASDSKWNEWFRQVDELLKEVGR